MRVQVELLWRRLIRFGFRLLYNEMAWTYDLVSWVVSLGQWRCWQRVALRYLPAPADGPLLDLAHGTGSLHLDLIEADHELIGYDLSPYMGRITQRKLQRQGKAVRLVRGAGQHLPFDDAVFPAVVCTFPTPFILEPATLCQLYRVLQPDGRLVIVMSGLLTGENPAVDVLEVLYRVTGQRGDNFDDLITPFTDAGFQAQLVWEICPGSRVLLIVAEKSM